MTLFNKVNISFSNSNDTYYMDFYQNGVLSFQIVTTKQKAAFSIKEMCLKLGIEYEQKIDKTLKPESYEI